MRKSCHALYLISLKLGPIFPGLLVRDYRKIRALEECFIGKWKDTVQVLVVEAEAEADRSQVTFVTGV